MTSKESHDMTEGLLGAAESMSAILDAVDGHRIEALRRGYSPTVAEQMAFEYYRMLLTAMAQAARQR